MTRFAHIALLPMLILFFSGRPAHAQADPCAGLTDPSQQAMCNQWVQHACTVPIVSPPHDCQSFFNNFQRRCGTQVACPQGAGLVCSATGSCVPGLVSWWTGDGTTLDLLGMNNASWVGTASYVNISPTIQAFSFTGSNYVQAPDSSSLDITGDLTLEACIQATNVTSSRIIDKTPVGTANGYLLDVLSGQLRMIAGGFAWVAGGTIAAGTTYHVVGVYSQSQSSITLYVNGAQVATQAIPVGATPVTTSPLRIGADQSGQNNFGGWIDEVKVYNVALAASDVATEANSERTLGTCPF